MDLMLIIDLFMNISGYLIQGIGIYLCLTPKYKLHISLVPCLVSSIIFVYVFGFLLNYNGMLWLKQLIMTSYYFTYTFLFFKDKKQYKITVAVFSQIALLIDDFIAGCIMAAIFGFDKITDDVLTRTLGSLLIIGTMALIYIVFVHFFKKFINKHTIQHFGMFILFPISQLILLIGSLYGIKIYNDYVRDNITSYNSSYETLAWWIIVLIASILCSVADIILYRVQKENSENKKLKENLELVNYRNELELEYYQQMQKNIEETRKIRHDFYNVLSAINDANEISSELKDEIETAIRQSSTATFCQNDIVNLIIVNKNKICLENNIRLDADLDIPEEIIVSKLDLLRVFSNILDNAIEANLKSNENRFIKLNAKIRDNYLFISAKNPLNSEIIKNNKRYETTKKQKNQHGFGMIILDDIAKKYDGELIAENNENSFTILISLKI